MRNVTANVDEELRFHLESRADDLVGHGQTREAATAQALSEMGNLAVVREGLQAIDRRVLRRRSLRERWRNFAGDVGYALRRLRASPMFTIAATLTLALAIGATTSVFALVDGVLLKTFPYRDPGRVLVIWESNPERLFPRFVVAPANYLDWRAQNHAFTTIAAVAYREFTVRGRQEAERLQGVSVTPSYFPVLGITPVLGRGLGVGSGGAPDVVLGYGYWQRRFGGAPSVLGESLTIDDTSYKIVGVMPPGLPGAEQLWTRLSFIGPQVTNRGGHNLIVLGRLKPGASREGAERELKTIADRLAATYPETNKGWTVVTFPLLDQLLGPVRPALVMVLLAAACVLLIGAANLSNLFLVRCLARQRELAVRTALGATRSRLMGELAIEAVSLGLLSSVIGVAVALDGVRVLRSVAPPTLPRLSAVGVDGQALAFCALTSIAAITLFGLFPAWQAARGNLAEVLKEGGRGAGSAQHRGAQDTLVVLQVAVALVLLTAAGLLVESFTRFERMDPGFRPDGVVTAQLALSPARYPTPERQTAFVTAVVDRLAAQPGVDQAAVGDAVPGAGPTPILFFAIIGDPAPDSTRMPQAYAIGAGPNYFRTMGIQLLRGRGILPTDDNRAPKIAIVDELLARRYFPGRDPIGQRFVFGSTPIGADTLTIVGIVASVKQGGLVAVDLPEMYGPMAQSNEPFASVAVHTTGDPATAGATIRRVVASLDPTVPVSDIVTMNAYMAQSIGTTRFSTCLASLFALVALVLGMIGIYSVLAYVVSQRQREIAVRIALGGSHGRVMRDVLRQAVLLASIGIMLGTIAAWILTQALAGLFLGVSPHDPAIIVGAAATFAAVALAAGSVPAFRTTRVNLVVALSAT